VYVVSLTSPVFITFLPGGLLLGEAVMMPSEAFAQSTYLLEEPSLT
jgi:hypothetical protein